MNNSYVGKQILEPQKIHFLRVYFFSVEGSTFTHEDSDGKKIKEVLFSILNIPFLLSSTSENGDNNLNLQRHLDFLLWVNIQLKFKLHHCCFFPLEGYTLLSKGGLGVAGGVPHPMNAEQRLWPPCIFWGFPGALCWPVWSLTDVC
jgi:hypothetical protein